MSKKPTPREIQALVNVTDECAADYLDRNQSFALRLDKLKASLEGVSDGYAKIGQTLDGVYLPLTLATLKLHEHQREFVQELIDHFEELEPAKDYADREDEV